MAMRVPDYGPGSISTKAKAKAMALPRVPEKMQAAKTYGPPAKKKMTLMEKLSASAQDAKTIQGRLEDERMPEADIRRGRR